MLNRAPTELLSADRRYFRFSSRVGRNLIAEKLGRSCLIILWSLVLSLYTQFPLLKYWVLHYNLLHGVLEQGGVGSRIIGVRTYNLYSESLPLRITTAYVQLISDKTLGLDLQVA